MLNVTYVLSCCQWKQNGWFHVYTSSMTGIYKHTHSGYIWTVRRRYMVSLELFRHYCYTLDSFKAVKWSLDFQFLLFHWQWQVCKLHTHRPENTGIGRLIGKNLAELGQFTNDSLLYFQRTIVKLSEFGKFLPFKRPINVQKTRYLHKNKRRKSGHMYPLGSVCAHAWILSCSYRERGYYCLTSHVTIFQLYMWRHIYVQADWRRLG